MKKRLLLVLTIVMLMCVAAFSANADYCEQGKHSSAIRTVAPTCTTEGYTQDYCPVCGYVYRTYDRKAPIPHVGPTVSYDAAGDHYVKKIACTQGCGQVVTYQENGEDVIYYEISFFNGHQMKERLLEKTIKGVTVTFRHTVVAASTELVQLDAIYVKKGESVRFTKACPERVKDVENSAYIFRGWVKDNGSFEYYETKDTKFENSLAYIPCTRYNYTQIEITKVNANTKYYAAWEAQKEKYFVQYTYNGGIHYLDRNISHGEKPYYPFAYPDNYVDAGYDYVFVGWGKGDPTKKDKDGNYTDYDEYLDKDIHVSEIPVYSGDAFKAIYNRIPRVYNVMLPGFTSPVDMAYGSSFNVTEEGDMFYVDIGGNGNKVGFKVKNEEPEYVYYFEKSNGFITDNNYEMRSDYFNLPDYVLDKDDIVYLQYNTGTNKGKTLMDGNTKIVLFNVEGRTSGKTFFDYYREELENYNKAYNSTNQDYKPLYFDIERTGEYFNLVTERGTKVLDKNNKEFIIRASWKGVYKSVSNELESEFYEEEAEALRIVNISPYYYRAVNNHTMIVEVIMPVSIDGTAKELMYDSYTNQMVVQVSDANGQLIKSGKTTRGKIVPVGENQYYHMYCELSVPYASRYNVTVVASEAMNSKYEGQREFSWEQFDYYDGNIRIDVDISDNYNENIRCSCLCHSAFKGVWATILNILNSFFKMRHVCCPHMFDEIGNLLKYKTP